MNIIITPESLNIDGLSVSTGVYGSTYAEVLGDPDRLEPIGPPAPFGHRNNHIWAYDRLGVFLAEHHATRMIQGVGIVLEPAHSYRRIENAFTGNVFVCGVAISRGMRAGTFAAQCSVPFRWHLNSRLVFDADAIAVDISTYRPKTASGRKSSIRYISVVSVGFRTHVSSQDERHGPTA